MNARGLRQPDKIKNVYNILSASRDISGSSSRKHGKTKTFNASLEKDRPAGHVVQWREEVFIINKVPHTTPVTYKIDYKNEAISKGTLFSEHELKVINNNKLVVEKVIRRRTKNRAMEALVKWSGLDRKFNSWIPFESENQPAVQCSIEKYRFNSSFIELILLLLFFLSLIWSFF